MSAPILKTALCGACTLVFLQSVQSLPASAQDAIPLAPGEWLVEMSGPIQLLIAGQELPQPDDVGPQTYCLDVPLDESYIRDRLEGSVCAIQDYSVESTEAVIRLSCDYEGIPIAGTIYLDAGPDQKSARTRAEFSGDMNGQPFIRIDAGAQMTHRGVCEAD